LSGQKVIPDTFKRICIFLISRGSIWIKSVSSS
jgi:hypothetical protein